jgi:hypothetical protein
MNGELEVPRGTGTGRDTAEDTVELELTAAEQLALAQASEAAMGSSAVVRADPGYDIFVYTRTRRADVAGTITFAAVVCAITAAVGWHALIAEPDARATPAATVVAPSAPVPAPRVASVVQVPNPFDATEVFELPAETSEADARNAIAQLLLQRAQERRQQGVHLRRAGTHRPYQASVTKPADVFVTKILAPGNRFTDMPGPRSGISE